MREQLLNRDPVPARAGDFGEELPNRIVEPEPALVVERHQGCHGNRLRDRTQHEEIIGRSGRPEGSGEHAVSVPDVEDRRVHLFFGHRVDQHVRSDVQLVPLLHGGDHGGRPSGPQPTLKEGSTVHGRRLQHAPEGLASTG